MCYEVNERRSTFEFYSCSWLKLPRQLILPNFSIGELPSMSEGGYSCPDGSRQQDTEGAPAGRRGDNGRAAQCSGQESHSVAAEDVNWGPCRMSENRSLGHSGTGNWWTDCTVRIAGANEQEWADWSVEIICHHIFIANKRWLFWSFGRNALTGKLNDKILLLWFLRVAFYFSGWCLCAFSQEIFSGFVMHGFMCDLWRSGFAFQHLNVNKILFWFWFFFIIFLL